MLLLSWIEKTTADAVLRCDLLELPAGNCIGIIIFLTLFLGKEPRPSTVMRGARTESVLEYHEDFWVFSSQNCLVFFLVFGLGKNLCCLKMKQSVPPELWSVPISLLFFSWWSLNVSIYVSLCVFICIICEYLCIIETNWRLALCGKLALLFCSLAAIHIPCFKNRR